MTISLLRIADFRNLSAVEIAPCQQGLNIIYGNNGSGKTSLLEAIHYLGLSRSFRSSYTNGLVRHTTNKFSLYAQLVSDAQAYVPVGVERQLNGATRLRMSEKDVATITEVAQFLPIRVINTHSHQLFEAGPNFRRKYLDWGLFYQNQHFLPCWRQFQRILKQRNAVLRQKRPKKELDIWTEELVTCGLELDGLRKAYLAQLTPLIKEMTQLLLEVTNLDISYQPGWDEGMGFAAALAEQFPQEIRSGHTQAGPQRADLEVSIQGVQVKHILSRGQQKLLVCAMILAQGMLLTQQANKGLVYLVDDLPAELDEAARRKLVSLLSKQQSQVFITAIDNEFFHDFHILERDVPTKVFHVEHGTVTNDVT